MVGRKERVGVIHGGRETMWRGPKGIRGGIEVVKKERGRREEEKGGIRKGLKEESEEKMNDERSAKVEGRRGDLSGEGELAGRAESVGSRVDRRTRGDTMPLLRAGSGREGVGI